MITFLVAASDETGIAEAMERGWTRIARSRFAISDRNEVRVVSRIADILVLPGGTPMLKGADYESGANGADELALDAWIKQKGEIDSFVESGGARWVEEAG